MTFYAIIELRKYLYKLLNSFKHMFNNKWKFFEKSPYNYSLTYKDIKLRLIKRHSSVHLPWAYSMNSFNYAIIAGLGDLHIYMMTVSLIFKFGMPLKRTNKK